MSNEVPRQCLLHDTCTLQHIKVFECQYVVVVTGLIGVHSMHGQVHPN